MTPTSGNRLAISRVAASPPPGMLISMMTTFGRYLATSATASGPLLASPTTCMSGSMARMRMSPSRSNGWSSAMSTVIGTTPQPLLLRTASPLPLQVCIPTPGPRSPAVDPPVVGLQLYGLLVAQLAHSHVPRHPRRYPGALSRRADDAKFAPQQPQPLAHVQDAEAVFAPHHLGGQPLRVKAHAVVLHHQVQARRAELEPDRRPPAAAVRQRVADGFLSHTKQRDLHRRRQAPRHAQHRELNIEAELLAHDVEIAAQRRHQAQ